MSKYWISSRANSLLRGLIGTTSELKQSASDIRQPASEMRKLDKKLDRILSEQAAAKATLTQTITLIHQIRRQLAFEEIKSNGFWFVDIPRTSSTSVRVELGERFGPAYGKRDAMEKGSGLDQLVGAHITAKNMSKSMGAKAYGDLLTFSIVRNPWARAYSFYRYRQVRKSIPQEWDFTEYCRRLSGKENNRKYFRRLIYSGRMVDHICNDAGEVMVSRVIRFEERQARLAELGEEIGCPSLGSLHLQRTSQSDDEYRSHYTSETEKLVGDYYAKDLEVFCYEF